MAPKHIAIFVALVLCGCTSQFCADTENLTWIVEADPISNARENHALGNSAFAAVQGFTIFLPGLDSDTEKMQKEMKNFKVIEGTSDDSCDPELNQMAVEYAKSYNFEILALAENGRP